MLLMSRSKPIFGINKTEFIVLKRKSGGAALLVS